MGINEIHMRNVRATDGPWYACEEKNGLYSVKNASDLICENCIFEDADFIAHAKNDVMLLLNGNAKLQKKLDALTQAKD